MLTCVPSCCCRVQWKWWLYTERKAGWSSFVHISKISVCNITLSVIGTFSNTTKDDLKHKTLLWHPRKSIKSESQVCFACVQWSAEKRSRGAQGRSAAWSVWYAAPLSRRPLSLRQSSASCFWFFPLFCVFGTSKLGRSNNVASTTKQCKCCVSYSLMERSKNWVMELII